MNQLDPSYPKKITPNRIINIIDLIRPLLDEIQSDIASRNYENAIKQFEMLEKKHGFIVTDMIRISEAYIHTGRLFEAKEFLLRVKRECERDKEHEPKIVQVRFILAQIEENIKEYFNLIDGVLIHRIPLEGNERHLLFTQLAVNAIDLGEESEYYTYMALQGLQRHNFTKSVFSPIMDLLLKNKQICSFRVAKQLKTLNDKFYHDIANAFPLEYSSVLHLYGLPVRDAEIEPALAPIVETQQVGVSTFLQSFFDQLLPEEATFAYAKA
jgi:hypothetical protein